MLAKNKIEFGILNIDKPSGPTSFDICDYVRKALKEKGFEVRKTSHFGTLDPKVTGVLPIALNRGCKLTGFFIGHEKEYVGIMRIHEDVEMKKIQEIINKKFTGVIKQTPPVKSRVKRQEREREVKEFKLLEQNGKDVLFRCLVQGGTYIRKLIDDLGKEIGGAHMLELRRTQAGIFSELDEKFLNLYDFEKVLEEKKLQDFIIPAEEALKKIFPVVEIKVNEKRLRQIFTGKPILKKDLKKQEKGKEVIVFSEGKFVGVYEVVDKGEVYAKPKFVLQPIVSKNKKV